MRRRAVLLAPLAVLLPAPKVIAAPSAIGFPAIGSLMGSAVGDALQAGAFLCLELSEGTARVLVNGAVVHEQPFCGDVARLEFIDGSPVVVAVGPNRAPAPLLAA
jgi:hypothetical protein